MSRLVDYTVFTKPVVEPLTLEDAMEHLRVDSIDEAPWLKDAIQAVRERAEKIMGRALITQTLETPLHRWPADRVIELPMPPLVSVTSIKYTPSSGVETTLASTNYLVDTRSTPGRIVLKTTANWPAAELIEVNGIVVRFVAGFGAAASDVPAEYRKAMKLWLGELYEVRENSAAGGLVTVPNAAERILFKYRVF